MCVHLPVGHKAHYCGGVSLSQFMGYVQFFLMWHVNQKMKAIFK